MFIQIVEDILQNLRSLTFAKNNIETNVKERVLFKNYKARFERSLSIYPDLENIFCIYPVHLGHLPFPHTYLSTYVCRNIIIGTLHDMLHICNHLVVSRWYAAPSPIPSPHLKSVEPQHYRIEVKYYIIL